MNRNVEKLETPLNASERFLYAIAVRQDVIIEMLNSVVEYIAGTNGLAVTQNVSSEIVESGITSNDVTDTLVYNDITKAEIITLLKKADVEFDERSKKADLLETLKAL